MICTPLLHIAILTFERIIVSVRAVAKIVFKLAIYASLKCHRSCTHPRVLKKIHPGCVGYSDHLGEHASRLYRNYDRLRSD